MGTSSKEEEERKAVRFSSEGSLFQRVFCPSSPAEKCSLSHAPNGPCSLAVKPTENLLSTHTQWLKAQSLHLDLPKCSSSHLQAITCSTDPALGRGLAAPGWL